MLTLAQRIARPALLLHAAISLAVGVLVFLLQLPALPKSEPILSTRMGDLTIALAGLCVLTAIMLPRDRRWLLVPMTVCAAEVTNNAVQAIIRAVGAGVRTDPQLAQPLVVYAVFLLIYTAAFVGIGNTTAGEPSTPAATEGLAGESGAL